jgi:hypothetical protein
LIVTDLLQLALDAQGGLAVWRSIRQIDVQLSISGGLWKVKGRPDGLPNISMQIDTQQPKLAIWPFKGVGDIGHFTPDQVWIEHDGMILEQRSSPRDSFAGHVRTTPWDNLHELYFTGYAFWNYFNTPFILRQDGIESREIERHVENGETWRRLQVKFPTGFPTHCSEQVFYFSDGGLLQRLDYITEVAGGVASHYCFDHATFGGLTFPMLRRVVRRSAAGPELSGPTAVLVVIQDIRVS